MKKAIIIGSIVTVVGTAVFLFIRRQRKLIEETGFEVLNIRYNSLDKGILSLTMDLKVINKSSISANVSSVSVDAYINGKKAGTAKTNRSYSVPAKGSVNAVVDIVIDLNELKKNAFDIANVSLEMKDASINLKADVAINKSGVNVNIPYSYTTSIKEILNI